jgi:hypothetical protein
MEIVTAKKHIFYSNIRDCGIFVKVVSIELTVDNDEYTRAKISSNSITHHNSP